MNFDHAHKHARDADEQAASLQHWDQRYEQLTAGRFEGEVDELCVGPAQVFSERANQTVMQAGRVGTDRISVALVRTALIPGCFCGHRLQGEHLIGIAPDGEFDLVAGAGMHILALSVETQALRALGAQLNGAEIGTIRPPLLLNPDRATLHAYKDLLNTCLKLAPDPAYPAYPAYPAGPCTPAAARRMLALSLTGTLLGFLQNASDTCTGIPTAANRRRIVARARQYMRAHAQEVIAVPDLCQAIGTSRRALQYAFEDVMQISPVTYLRAMRLNQVRSELRRQPEASVGDVAAQWGFWHLSRFAADYRTLFGERPSATRAASAQASVKACAR